MDGQSFSSNEEQLVAFKLGREEYGVSILLVQEIKRMSDITRVPHAPDYIEGVINLRGSVLPVIDLKKRLNLQPEEHTDDTRIIIIKIDEITVGIIVDAVSEVMTINRENVDPTYGVVGGIAENYLSGIAKLENRLLILLNMEAILGVGQDVSKAG